MKKLSLFGLFILIIIGGLWVIVSKKTLKQQNVIFLRPTLDLMLKK